MAEIFKKILYIASEPAPGMVPFASSIINSAKSSGMEVWAITVSKAELSFSDVICEDVHLFDTSYPTTLWGKFKFHFFPAKLYRTIQKVADSNGIEEIHFLTGEYGMGVCFTSLINRRYRLTYVVHDWDQHPSGNDNNNVLSKLFEWWFHRMTHFNARVSNCLATCSRSQYECLCKISSFAGKQIIYFPFPSLVTESIMNGTDECHELVGINKYILFFGRVCFYKGIHILYDAFLNSRLADEYKLVIAGAGDVFFSHRTDERNVIFINRFIPDSEINFLFSNSDFVVYPYLQVTMSGVLQMAHYFGKRAIISDLPFFLDNMIESDMQFECGIADSLCLRMEQMAYEVSFDK